MSWILKLLKEGYKFVELIRHRYPTKVHAVRIPHRRGFYQRKEGKEVMITLKTPLQIWQFLAREDPDFTWANRTR